MSHSKLTRRGRSLYLEKWNPSAKKYICTCALCGKQGYSPAILEPDFVSAPGKLQNLERYAIREELIKTLCALPLDAGTCMAYGFSEEAALASLTRSPARVLGIADRVGTVEAGKDADLAVFDGFPLSNYTLCKGVFIDGAYYESKEAY